MTLLGFHSAGSPWAPRLHWSGDHYVPWDNAGVFIVQRPTVPQSSTNYIDHSCLFANMGTRRDEQWALSYITVLTHLIPLPQDFSWMMHSANELMAQQCVCKVQQLMFSLTPCA